MYKIYNGSKLINSIVSDLNFVEDYCAKMGYTFEYTPDMNTLAQEKETRIAQSKQLLADYLAAHPLLWTDGLYYSITAEKQAQLTSKIMAATLAQILSTDYDLTWNSTGEVCKEWALSDLSALAFAIDARVTSLVTYQQTQEVAIRNAATLEELETVVVDYNSVEAGT